MTSNGVPAKYWTLLEDGKIRCDLCPRDCMLREGQAGHCFVRLRQGDEMLLTTYGRSSGFCMDPIEKKPLNHFYPGSSVLSFGTAGCNLACRFCQNWDISKSRDQDRLSSKASPEAIALAAERAGSKSVAFTYNDPVIFAEYAMDVADACHSHGISSVAVSAGYIHPKPRAEFFSKMDAANIDLKAFSEDFYVNFTGGHLQPILETLEYLAQSKTWLEITTLLIPGLNDSEREISEMSSWILEKLGPDVPLHFSAFHPDFKMLKLPSTPVSTLKKARALAKEIGLHHVYLGNVHDAEGDTTFCPDCGKAVIQRDWYEIRKVNIRPGGNCGSCGGKISGHLEMTPEPFGRKRIPIQI